MIRYGLRSFSAEKLIHPCVPCVLWPPNILTWPLVRGNMCRCQQFLSRLPNVSRADARIVMLMISSSNHHITVKRKFWKTDIVDHFWNIRVTIRTQSTLNNTNPGFRRGPCLFDSVCQILSAQPCLAVVSQHVVIKEWAAQYLWLVNGCCLWLMDQEHRISDFPCETKPSPKLAVCLVSVVTSSPLESTLLDAGICGTPPSRVGTFDEVTWCVFLESESAPSTAYSALVQVFQAFKNKSKTLMLSTLPRMSVARK